MAERLPTMYGRYYTISAVWRGKQFTVNVFRPKLQLLQRPGAQRIVDKIYPGSRVISFWESDPTDAPVFLVKEEVTRTMKILDNLESTAVSSMTWLLTSVVTAMPLDIMPMGRSVLSVTEEELCRPLTTAQRWKRATIRKSILESIQKHRRM